MADAAALRAAVEYASVVGALTCCNAGAIEGQPTAEEVERMRQFGEFTGIAFQIKDDLFDYGSGQDTGKPTGLDIKEKKLTLPLIHALRNVDARDRRWMVDVVKNRNEDSDAVAQLVEKVAAVGGIAHANKHMYAYRDKALAELRTFPQNEARDALEGLVELTVERTK